MNTLVGKIFEDRKNSARKVVVRDYQVSANDIEVVTIEFLEGCGKKAGTTENKFLKSFKKSWKETNEVIEETVVEEPAHVEVVDTEENLSDEDYAKIGVEIAEQAKQKTKKKSKKSKKENTVSKDERANVVREYLESKSVTYKERFYSGERLKCIAILSGKKKLAEIYPQRKSFAIYVSKLVDLSDIPTTHSDYFLCQRVDTVDISLLEKVIERLDL